MVRDLSAQFKDSESHLFDRRTLYESALLFVAAGAVLFLFSNRMVGVFDEGILLSGVMRTMAGQVLHRDFYYNYGPGQFCILAGLFKLFGPSVLILRLADVVSNACLVVTMYILTRRFCGRRVAVLVVAVCICWLIGLVMTQTMMNPALCLLTLCTSWLILPLNDERQQRHRAVIAGFLTGILFLFRYDVGVEMIVANLVAIAAMNWLEQPSSRRPVHRLASTVIGPYLALFAVTILPFAIAYLSRAPLHDLLYDTVLYGRGPYPLGRGMPFPRPRLGQTFQEIAVYLMPVIMVLGLWVVVQWAVTQRTSGDQTAHRVPEWVNLLLSLTVTAAMMYARGLVRVGVGHMDTSLFPCLLIAALLFRHRVKLGLWVRGLLAAAIACLGLATISSAQTQLFDHNWHLKPLAINWILTPGRQPPSPEFRDWCHENTPITKGFCFLVSEDRIRAIRYINSHTRSGDYLYEGLPHHDRIMMNDNIIYFATQRLPAVKWSQLDPLVENLADIQAQMVVELEQHKPPYIVIDSEFDDIREPNASAVSTGVHLLDDYIAEHYKTVQQYGKLTILQRQE